MADALTTSLSDATTRFRQVVEPKLRAILRKTRQYAIIDGAGRLSNTLSVCWLIQWILDYGLRLPVDMRATILAMIVLVIIYSFGRHIGKIWKKSLYLQDVAELIERRFPQLDSRLISALQLSESSALSATTHSTALVSKLLSQTRSALESLPLKQLLNHRRARWQGLHALHFPILILLFVLLAPETARTYFERNILLGSVAWKQHTTLKILNDDNQDGILQVPSGDDLRIRVQALGVVPRQVTLQLNFDSDRIDSQPMTAVGLDEFHYTLPRLSEPLSFIVEGGDASNEPVRVELTDRPAIRQTQVTLIPPAYTQEAPSQLRENKNLIELLSGSEIEMTFTTNKPIQLATLMCEQEAQPDNAVNPIDEYHYLLRFKPQKSATYTLELVDQSGLTNIKPQPWIVRLVPDSPPTVTLQVDSLTDLVTPQAILNLDLQIKDRYGIGSATLVHQISSNPPREESTPIDDLVVNSKQFETQRRWSLASIGAQENQQLAFYARAEDLNNVSGPGIGKSVDYSFRVVSPEELLTELGRQEQEFRQQFEQIIETQEILRNDLLTASSNPDQLPKGVSAAFERRQRQLAKQTEYLQTQFQRIFNELVTNQLHSEEVEERLLKDIVHPMKTLASEAMLPAAQTFNPLSDAPDAQTWMKIDQQQAVILTQMQQILNHMTRWEGFHETISLLQTIIKLQKELQQETQATLSRQIDELLGGKQEQKK